MDKVAIFGGTGFIGQSLAKHLSAQGLEPIIIARNPPKEPSKYVFAKWDGQTVGDWAKLLNDCTAIVNLAGRTVDCIKTPENIDTILRSRVDTTKIIGKALNGLSTPPKVWVQMSTAHMYGDSETVLCTESSTFGYGLAPFVGKAWEKAFNESLPAGVRGVLVRTSFVIGKNGGALQALKRIVRLGLGGKAGSGKQGMSWIHEWDMNEVFLLAIRNEGYKGPYIASAPNPVAQKDFMKTLRKKMRMPFGLAAPDMMLRLGAHIFFKTDPELVLYGRYVRSERLEDEGFTFKYPTLESALDDLI